MYRGLAHGLARATAQQLAFADGITGTGAASLDALTGTAYGIASDAALELDFTFGDIDSRLAFSRTGTATRINSAGLVETVSANTARIEYDPVTLARRGLLVEETRQNIFAPGTTSLSTYLTKQGTATTQDEAAIASPYGDLSSALVARIISAPDFANRVEKFFGTVAATNDAQWSASAWVRAVTGSVTGSISVTDGAGTNTTTNSFTVGTTWTRVSAAQPGTGGAATNRLIRFFGLTGALYVSCLQLEAGPFASSYIPTTTASVTRNTDQVTVTPLGSWFNAATGTLYCEAVPVGLNSGVNLQTFLYFDDTTTNERFGFRASSGINNALMVDGGATQASISAGTLTAGTTIKMAFAYALNDFASCANGGAVGTDAAGTLATVTRLLIGSRLAGTDCGNAIFRKAKVYTTRKTNAEIQAMTA